MGGRQIDSTDVGGPGRLELTGGRVVTVGAVASGAMVLARLAGAAAAAVTGLTVLVPWVLAGAVAHAVAVVLNRWRWPRVALLVGSVEVAMVGVAGAVLVPAGWTFALHLLAWTPVVFIGPLWRHQARNVWLLLVVLIVVVIPGIAPSGEVVAVWASVNSAGALCLLAAVIGVLSASFERMAMAERKVQQLRSQLEGRDGLTGLLTRRRAAERMVEEEARTRRHGRPFSCVLADVDDFRDVGERHGSACAEWVLVTIANLLKKAVRSSDALARWDGQQFLMVMPETEAVGAAAAAERVRQAIEHGSYSFEGTEVRFAVTFGVAEWFPELAVSSLDAAEAALTEGKRQGGNRVVVGEPERAQGG